MPPAITIIPPRKVEFYIALLRATLITCSPQMTNGQPKDPWGMEIGPVVGGMVKYEATAVREMSTRSSTKSWWTPIGTAIESRGTRRSSCSSTTKTSSR